MLAFRWGPGQLFWVLVWLSLVLVWVRLVVVFDLIMRANYMSG